MKLLIVCFLTLLMTPSQTIVDFNTNSSLQNWYVVDDGVMGGLSKGQFTISEEGHGRFFGTVRLENNGGFSSVRHPFDSIDVSEFNTVCIRLKGDGKTYQFRVRDERSTRHSYLYPFKTSGDWEVVEIPLAEMYPSFRGRTLNLPKFDKNTIEELTFLIGNKKNEPFELFIDHITLK